jgi:flagellar hook-basal body complex protein FliE
MTSPIDTTRMLMELRAMAAQAGKAPTNEAAAGTAGAAGTAPLDFGNVLSSALQQVNDMQQSAEALGNAFEQGQPGVDITRVMLEAQKANLAFHAMTEARNRLVAAYQDIMNMSV